MALFSRRPRPPAQILEEAATRCGESPADVARRVLAFGSGQDTWVVALTDKLVLHDGDEWIVATWPQVRGGTWSGDDRLGVTLLDGSTRSLRLSDPGRVPEVFQERVEAAILVEDRIPVPRGEVVISGRRSPDPDRPGPVLWHAMAVGGADLSDPQVKARVLRATNRLRAEWDI